MIPALRSLARPLSLISAHHQMFFLSSRRCAVAAGCVRDGHFVSRACRTSFSETTPLTSRNPPGESPPPLPFLIFVRASIGPSVRPHRPLIIQSLIFFLFYYFFFIFFASFLLIHRHLPRHLLERGENRMGRRKKKKAFFQLYLCLPPSLSQLTAPLLSPPLPSPPLSISYKPPRTPLPPPPPTSFFL